MKIFRKICNFLSNICCGISAASCIIMMLLVTLDATGRSIFSSPVTGAYEICQYLLCLILFGGYAYCQSQHGFLHVTMIIRKFPRKLKCVVWSLASLFGVVVGATLTYQCYKSSLTVLASNEFSTLLKIPKYPFEFYASFAVAIMTLNLVCDAVEAIIAIFNDKYAAQIESEWT